MAPYLTDDEVRQMLETKGFHHVLKMSQEGVPTLDIIETLVETDEGDSVFSNTSYGILLCYESFVTGKDLVTDVEIEYISERGGILVIQPDQTTNTVKTLTLRRLITFLDGNDRFNEWFAGRPSVYDDDIE